MSARRVALALAAVLVLGGCTSGAPPDPLSIPTPSGHRGGNGVPAPLATTPTGEPAPQQRVAAIGDGIFSVACPYSHTLPDDPIVAPGQPGMVHSHDFGCNRGTNALSTVESLTLAAEGTSADQLGDTSAVWWPTLYQNGFSLQPKAVFTYYDAGRLPTVRAFPPGLKIIAGNAGAVELQDPRVMQWGCVGQPMTAGTSIPPETCPTRMVLRINFPNCMKSTLDLDSADHKAHMAYSWVDGSPDKCPTSHPVGTVALNIGIRWEVTEPHGVLTLSSGAPRTAHADYVHSWDQAVFDTRVQNCILAAIKCGTRQDGIG